MPGLPHPGKTENIFSKIFSATKLREKRSDSALHFFLSLHYIQRLARENQSNNSRIKTFPPSRRTTSTKSVVFISLWCWLTATSTVLDSAPELTISKLVNTTLAFYIPLKEQPWPELNCQATKVCRSIHQTCNATQAAINAGYSRNGLLHPSDNIKNLKFHKKSMSKWGIAQEQIPTLEQMEFCAWFVAK